MKFSCTQENLLQGLQVVSHAAGKNISLPILNNVLIKIENKELKLVTTNLEMAISCRLRAKVDEEGDFTVPCRLLTDYLSVSSPGRVDVEQKDSELLVQSASDKTTIKGNVAVDFPLVPQLERKKVYGLKVADFKEMAQKVIFAASKNEARPELGGVLLNFNPDYKQWHLVSAATDSYRLAEKEVKLLENLSNKSYSAETSKVIVPVRALQEILRIVSTYHEDLEEEQPVEIVVSDSQILFSFGMVELVSRLIEGQYPDYRQIIPASSKTSISFNVAEWIKRIKAASLFSNVGINGIVLTFKAGNEQKTTFVSTNGQLGNYTSEELCQIEGEDNHILLNYRYLLDGLMNLVAEEAVLKVISPNSPCVLSSKNSSGYLYIIMPIKE
ncbi:MAG TPA: DNA polymerase III subunit beta [Candidatus Magasanikbacteria bacterium]|uniref:Beta sliding clamp n=1 Tax=Candidatus Magasanikbacteria bacterium GW2011_GWC2_41_17 TaxID=1619048 RepID=A0A0G0VHQ7_9BACT|nr:MAG: polymerase III subunit beta protein [Candidatus Magasanikbacteria bacterium GW2011_GWC2_41_17]HBV58115.1 DNA polymerase III subunit beta [Candidatus Magasanikbacteria bacterium]HBX16342.1 DNA polymerase III subunit beta [Candidatus Magasanikbacteria bacterium]